MEKNKFLNLDWTAARAAWSYALVFLVLWSLFIVRATILLFALALMFAYLLYPLVEVVQRRFKGKSSSFAVALPFVSILVLGIAAFFLMRAPVLREAHALRQQIGGVEFRQRLLGWQPLGVPVGQKIAEAEGLNHIQTQLISMMPQLGRSVSRAGRDLGNLFIIPILAFFMLKDGRRIADCVINLCCSVSDRAASMTNRRKIAGIVSDAHTLILGYVRSLVLLCFAVLIVFSLALTLLRVQYALLLALLAFALEFIPLIGPLVAGSLILLVSEFNQYPHLGRILAFLLVFRLFQDYVLSPQLMERTIRLHPLLVIFGVFAGGEIGGIGGIFLSVPLLALARLIFYESRKQRDSNVTDTERMLDSPVGYGAQPLSVDDRQRPAETTQSTIRQGERARTNQIGSMQADESPALTAAF